MQTRQETYYKDVHTGLCCKGTVSCNIFQITQKLHDKYWEDHEEASPIEPHRMEKLQKDRAYVQLEEAYIMLKVAICEINFKVVELSNAAQGEKKDILGKALQQLHKKINDSYAVFAQSGASAIEE